ncbi:MAG: CinA family protein [Halobacteriaceae archaeon]
MSESDDEAPAPDRVAPAVVETLAAREATLAVAESHTGGRVCNAIVRVPGASAVFEEGVVTYGYGTKRRRLAVPRETLDAHGSVSSEVASAMAAGVRDTAETTWGLATTGVAGPGGGTESTPVGTTYVGVAYAAPWESGESYARATRSALSGDREAVIERATGVALAELRRHLEAEQ